MFANQGLFFYHALKVVQKCFTDNLWQHSCKKKKEKKRKAPKPAAEDLSPIPEPFNGP